MRVLGSAVLTISCMPYSSAFVVPQAAFRPMETRLNLERADDDSKSQQIWAGPLVAAFAGLALVSQPAVASPPMTSPSVEITRGKISLCLPKFQFLAFARQLTFVSVVMLTQT